MFAALDKRQRELNAKVDFESFKLVQLKIYWTSIIFFTFIVWFFDNQFYDNLISDYEHSSSLISQRISQYQLLSQLIETIFIMETLGDIGYDPENPPQSPYQIGEYLHLFQCIKTIDGLPITTKTKLSQIILKDVDIYCVDCYSWHYYIMLVEWQKIRQQRL